MNPNTRSLINGVPTTIINAVTADVNRMGAPTDNLAVMVVADAPGGPANYIYGPAGWVMQTAVVPGGGAAVAVVNDLTTGGNTAALSATQGKALKDAADALALTVGGKASLASANNWALAQTSILAAVAYEAKRPDARMFLSR